jgi:putative addiction module killer protein
VFNLAIKRAICWNSTTLTPVASRLHCLVLKIRKTELFANWLDSLRDVRARARVQVRIERLAAGNPGDVQPVGEGVSELRIDYGPGYQVYFKKIGSEVLILLAGGDKRTQGADIKTALRLARNL